MANPGIKTSIKIEGLDQLRRALKALPEKVQQRSLSAAVAAGARVVLAEARAMVPVDTGLLKRMLRATRGVRRGSEASAFISVRRLSHKRIAEYKRITGRSSSRNSLDPFYWTILEFGKSTRTAHPFIRPAFNAKKHEAADKIKTELSAAIEKEVALVAWRGGK